MIQFNPMTAGYIAIGILILFSATFAASVKLLRVRADNTPEIGLNQNVPSAPEGLCATTIYIANHSRHPIFIRNITIGCGTFAGSEIYNLLGQITSYNHSTDLQRLFNISVAPGTKSEEPVVFHAQVGIPVEATLVSKNDVYEIHLSQVAKRL